MPSPATRAVITDGTGKTLNPFDVDTKIFMVMKSEYGQADFGGNHDTKYNVARGDVNVTKNDNTNHRSIVDFDTKNQRYWDDAHARSSQLSIWAYAQKGQSTWNNCTFNGAQYKTEADATQPYAWTTTEIVPTILTWRATHLDGKEDQNEQSVQAQDLLFSNNLANYDTNPSSDPSKDKRLKFNFSTRKFPQVGEANMIFYHAMSKITIKIIEGEGFDKTSASKADDFKFTTTGGNIILKQFNHTGTFDIKQGEFTSIASGGTTDIPSIYLQTTNINATGTDPHYVLEALAVPSIANNGMSRFVDERKDLTNDVMMEFAIDNNLYHITHDDLYEALKGKANATMMTDNGNYIPLEAGKNYIFTFTVGKQRIDHLTAQVAPWEDVNADNIKPSNARIELLLEERGTAQTSDVAFYKANDNKTTEGIDDNYTTWNWNTGYTNLNASYSTDHWTTNFFWESNKDFYHFRALMPASTVVKTADSKDYFEISSSSCANADSYNAIAWGAPMLDDGKNDTSGSFKWYYGPTKNGFDANDGGNIAVGLTGSHQIYKAIGPTEDPVKLILFHMMSGVHFTIKTDDAKTDKVELYDGTLHTKVDLVGYYPTGRVLLGTGLVNADGTVSTIVAPQNIDCATTATGHYNNQDYFFSAVPQDLTSVKLYITTPDNNQYIVDLKDVKATTVNTNNIANPYQLTNGKYIINRWYPGFKYNYSFTLAKTGITNLQATIVDWETVTAADETVQIK